MRGDAEVTNDDGGFAQRVGKKYETDLRVYDRPGDERIVVRIIPSRVNLPRRYRGADSHPRSMMKVRVHVRPMRMSSVTLEKVRDVKFRDN